MRVHRSSARASARLVCVSTTGRRAASTLVARTRELDLTTYALAFGAQQLLCTVPLVVAASAVFARGPDRGVGAATASFFNLHGQARTTVIAMLPRPASAITAPALIFSLAVAVVLATGVAAIQQRAFELVWDLPARRPGSNSRAVRPPWCATAWTRAVTS